jgi:hypothetical protein
MRKSHLIKSEGMALILSAGELWDIIDCVAAAADRAESSAYGAAGTPRARQVARATAAADPFMESERELTKLMLSTQ